MYTQINREMPRREVAELIFPDSRGRVAVNRLGRWIKADPALRRALQQKGYAKHKQILTMPVLRVLQSYLSF